MTVRDVIFVGVLVVVLAVAAVVFTPPKDRPKGWRE